jgi:hypothetical protein
MRSRQPKLPKRPARNPFRDSYTERPYRPYALAIGQVALAWNDLCSVLAGIYWTVMGGGFPEIYLATWNAIKSDRTQRDMLRDALKAYFQSSLGLIGLERYPTAAADFDWLIVEAGKLEDARNNAVHGPLVLNREGGDIVFPSPLMANPRAKRLQALVDKRESLLAEFRRCRETAICLRDYGWRMDLVLSLARGTWPERPKLPIRRPLTTRPRRRSTPEGQPPSPPASSP